MLITELSIIKEWSSIWLETGVMLVIETFKFLGF